MPSPQSQELEATMENVEIDEDTRATANPNEETTIPVEAASPHVALYKCNSKVTESQKERRFKFLEEQKERRGNFIDSVRQLSDLFVEEADENDPRWQGYHRPSRVMRFSRKLMQAEYFTDVPEDLAENWFFKLCPKGQRCLVVAKGTITKFYWECGQEFYCCSTNFPGGRPTHNEQSDSYTILDCVIIRKLRIVLVFDVLAWNGTALMECTADMRFYWLQSKFSEDESLCQSRNRNDPYTFMHVPWGFAEKSAIEEAIRTEFKVGDELVRYQGVLFYHKEGLYSTKRTPLVGWLLPCMLTELFNVNLIPELCTSKPPSYENIHTYVEGIIAKKRAKNEARKLARNLKKLKDKEMIDVSANGEEEMEKDEGTENGETTESGANVKDSPENKNMEIEGVYQEAAELEMS